MTKHITERPILFSGPMVRAILEGRKTQTRRVMKPQPAEPQAIYSDGHSGLGCYSFDAEYPEEGSWFASCPYGKPGDRLWVREAFCDYATEIVTDRGSHTEAPRAIYRADGSTLLNGFKWKPSIHMPRWASRLTLEITGVRVERVQDISEEDARAEGIKPEWCHIKGCGPHAQGGFCQLWDSINAQRGFGWEANPWVWVIDFIEATRA